MKHIYLLLLVLFSCSLSAQQSPIEKPKKFHLESFGYPISSFNEQHAMFKVNYEVSDKFHMELQTFYDTYLTSNRTRVALRVKKFIGSKLYVFSVSEIEFSQDKVGGPSCQKPRASIGSGAGYQINEKISLEAGINFAINKGTIGAFGEPAFTIPVMSAFSSRIRF
ncbi:MAG: hypothetical protein AAGA43_14675 [Bacteroidota bacterium]